MSDFKVGYLIGSRAAGSINRKLAMALVKLAPADLAMSEIDYGDLPIYSYDYDADYPPAGRAFKAALAKVDAALARIAERPRQYPEIARAVRRSLLRVFPYSIYFTIVDDAVRVFAVLHQHRHPASWKHRVP